MPSDHFRFTTAQVIYDCTRTPGLLVTWENGVLTSKFGKYENGWEKKAENRTAVSQTHLMLLSFDKYDLIKT